MFWFQKSWKGHLRNVKLYLKWTVARDFYPWFFSWIDPIWAPDSHSKIFFYSVSNSRRYSYSKVKIRKSALSDTALIPNQCCIIQSWFWISVVGYSAKSEAALYPTVLIASQERWLGKNIPLKTYISVVGYSANSNQRCIIQRWFMNTALIRLLNFKNDV